MLFNVSWAIDQAIDVIFNWEDASTVKLLLYEVKYWFEV